MSVIISRSRSHEQKGRKFPKCKILIGNNSGSIEPRNLRLAYVPGYGGLNVVAVVFVT